MSSPDFRVLFWDIGGVLLTNGFDRGSRKRAIEKFGLDGADYEQRHAMAVPELETGRITLDEYLRETVFCSERAFSPEAFKEFMRGESKPIPGVREIARECADSGRFVMSTFNNESRELNAFRLDTFELRELFSFFICSSYIGVMKPAESFYRLALDVTQQEGANTLLIDDRPLNIEGAERAGMRALLFEDAAQLRRELSGRNVLNAGS